MSSDDDLFVAIVGDESTYEWNSFQLGKEIFDNKIQKEVENLLLTASERGEVLELHLKGGNDVNNEEIVINSLSDDEDNFSLKVGIKVEHIPSEIYDCLQYGKVNKRFKSNLGLEKNKYKFNRIIKYKDANNVNREERPDHNIRHDTDKVAHSYVNQLLIQHPVMRHNKDLLVNSLIKAMHETIPSNVPENAYRKDNSMYRCLTCGALSKTIPAADRHYREKHGERYLTCLACGDDFRSTTNLYKHEKRCEAPYIKCVLMARARSVVRRHRNRPFMPLKKWKCSECSRLFGCALTLEKHHQEQHGERPYLCSYCPTTFASQQSLRRHMQVHGTQRYICDHCSRVFKYRSAIATHMNTHAPLRKYPCSECSKRYSQKSDLILHVNRDHKNLPLPFACKICSKSYRRMSALKEHTRKEHGMVIMKRNVFFKQLPMMTNKQLEGAKVVFKSSAASKHTPPVSLM